MLLPWIARAPRGMSIAEARLAGIVPPEGWVAPRRDRVRDAARTAGVLARLLARMAIDARRAVPTGDTTTPAGLAALQRALAASARRLRIIVEVTGAERVPRDGGVVFMWNQTSHLDHLVLPLALPRPFHSLYNNEIRRFPIYGAYIARADHFWIDRTDEAQWRRQIAIAAERVNAGACVLVSPEGTRSWDGRLLPMKRGAFLLARLAERPIVCATIRGARELLPRGRLAVRPGAIAVELSDPIPVRAPAPDLESRVVATFQAALG